MRLVPRLSGMDLGTSLGKVLVHCLGGAKTLGSNFGLRGAQAPHKTQMGAKTEDQTGNFHGKEGCAQG